MRNGSFVGYVFLLSFNIISAQLSAYRERLSNSHVTGWTTVYGYYRESGPRQAESLVAIHPDIPEESETPERDHSAPRELVKNRNARTSREVDKLSHPLL